MSSLAAVKRYRQTPKGKATAAAASKRYGKTANGIAKRRESDKRRLGIRSAYEHKRSLARLYGITPGYYRQMLTAQKGQCAICKSTDPGASKRRLAVDHNHKTGKIRGLLCNSCNQALGLFHDSPIILRTAIAYLCLSNT